MAMILLTKNGYTQSKLVAEREKKDWGKRGYLNVRIIEEKRDIKVCFYNLTTIYYLVCDD